MAEVRGVWDVDATAVVEGAVAFQPLHGSEERVDDFRSSCAAQATGSSLGCLVPCQMSHRISA